MTCISMEEEATDVMALFGQLQTSTPVGPRTHQFEKAVKSSPICHLHGIVLYEMEEDGVRKIVVLSRQIRLMATRSVKMLEVTIGTWVQLEVNMATLEVTALYDIQPPLPTQIFHDSFTVKTTASLFVPMTEEEEEETPPDCSLWAPSPIGWIRDTKRLFHGRLPGYWYEVTLRGDSSTFQTLEVESIDAMVVKPPAGAALHPYLRPDNKAIKRAWSLLPKASEKNRLLNTTSVNVAIVMRENTRPVNSSGEKRLKHGQLLSERHGLLEAEISVQKGTWVKYEEVETKPGGFHVARRITGALSLHLPRLRIVNNPNVDGYDVQVLLSVPWAEFRNGLFDHRLGNISVSKNHCDTIENAIKTDYGYNEIPAHLSLSVWVGLNTDKLTNSKTGNKRTSDGGIAYTHFHWEVKALDESKLAISAGFVALRKLADAELKKENLLIL